MVDSDVKTICKINNPDIAAAKVEAFIKKLLLSYKLF